MANSLGSKVDIFFANVVNKFEAMNITAKNVKKEKPNAGSLAEADQTYYRKVQQMTQVVDGLDISSSYRDITELTVPSSLLTSHLRNVPVPLSGAELNNPHIESDIVGAAALLLSNKIDTIVADKIADEGTLVVTNAGSISSFSDVAAAQAMMTRNQVPGGDRYMIFNPEDSITVGANVADRATMSGIPSSVYKSGDLPQVASFGVYSTDYAKIISGSSGSGYLVNGAGQGHTPLTKSGGLPVDNRTQVLAVDTGSSAAVGDAFTIAGVFEVGHINKKSTGKLKTFRIRAINGANWTISPAIIPANGAADAQQDYANVTAEPADNAAITILNIADAPVNTFYSKSAVELIHSDFNLEVFGMTGKKVRKSTTDSGIQIAMLADSSIDDLSATYRMFIWANATLLDPERAGILIGNQT